MPQHVEHRQAAQKLQQEAQTYCAFERVSAAPAATPPAQVAQQQTQQNAQIDDLVLGLLRQICVSQDTVRSCTESWLRGDGKGLVRNFRLCGLML